MELETYQATYHYSPLLEPDSIRLIQLQPSFDKAAQLECRLNHTTLRQTKAEIIDQFTALSYVWGDAEEKRAVLIDGLAFHITVNLECALRHLRDETRTIHVWADAICIDQTNDKERSHQVGQMGSIYKAAHHTDVAQVFEQLAFQYDRSSSGLDILGHIEDVELDECRPNKASWAPDWSTSTRPPKAFTRPDTAGTFHVSHFPYRNRFNYEFLTWPSERRGPKLLCAVVLVFASIEQITNQIDASISPDTDDFTDERLREGLYNPQLWYNNRYSWWLDRLGQHQSALPASPQVSDHSSYEKLHYDFHGGWNDESPEESGWKYVLDHLVLKRDFGTSVVDGRKIARLTNLTDNAINGKLALVPSSSQIGDQLCLIAGSKLALVVREGGYIPDAYESTRVQSLLKEPSLRWGAKADLQVKYVRIVGECLVDELYDELQKNGKVIAQAKKEIIAVY